MSFNLPSAAQSQFVSPKFSVDKLYISYLRNPGEIIILSLLDNAESKYAVKNALNGNEILGYYWTHVGEMLFITKQGLEVVKLTPPMTRLGSLSIKVVKTVSTAINWYVYSHEHRLVILWSSAAPASVVGYHFPPNIQVKLPKIDLLDLDKREKLARADIYIVQLYGVLYMLHLHAVQQQIYLYELGKEDIRKKFSLAVPVLAGNLLTVNVVDNVLLVHCKTARYTLLYDVKCAAAPPLNLIQPLLPGIEIAPFLPDAVYNNAAASTGTMRGRGASPGVPLYSDSWLIHQPCFVFDSREGYLWEIKLNLSELAEVFENKPQLIGFLLRRASAKTLILRVLRSCLENRMGLSDVARIFESINFAYSSHIMQKYLEMHNRKSMGGTFDSSKSLSTHVVASARFAHLHPHAHPPTHIHLHASA